MSKIPGALLLLLLWAPQVAQGEQFKDLQKKSGEIRIFRDRVVSDFDVLPSLATRVDAKILVTTTSESPTAFEYEAAMAFRNALKAKYQNVSFSVGQKGDAEFVVNVLLLGAGGKESTFQAPIRGQRTTGVICSGGISSVECKESQSQSTVIGSRSVEEMLRYVDLHFSLDQRIPDSGGGWHAVEISTEEISIAWGSSRGKCENQPAAAATVAEFLTREFTVNKPIKDSFWTSDKLLGCRS